MNNIIFIKIHHNRLDVISESGYSQSGKPILGFCGDNLVNNLHIEFDESWKDYTKYINFKPTGAAEQCDGGFVENTIDYFLPSSVMVKGSLTLQIEGRQLVDNISHIGHSVSIECEVLSSISANNQTSAGVAIVGGDMFKTDYAKGIGKDNTNEIDHALSAVSLDFPLTKSDVGLSNVDNTADVNKPVSSAQQTAINTAVAGIVNSAPSTLDTLKELADALGDDNNFASTVASELGNKVDKVTGQGLYNNDMADARITAQKGQNGGLATLDPITGCVEETAQRANVAQNYLLPDGASMASISDALVARPKSTDLSLVALTGSYNSLLNLPNTITVVSYQDMGNYPISSSDNIIMFHTDPIVDNTMIPILPNASDAVNKEYIFSVIDGGSSVLFYNILLRDGTALNPLSLDATNNFAVIKSDGTNWWLIDGAYYLTSLIGSSYGIAPLDGDNKVPMDNLPTYPTQYTNAMALAQVALYNPSVTTVTGSYSVLSTDNTVLVNNSAAVNISLPNPANNAGRKITVKKISNNAFGVTILGYSGGFLDAYNSYVISRQYGLLTIQSDGANWNVVSYSDTMMFGYLATMKNTANGVAGLDGAGLVLPANLPINVASGVAPLDANSKLPLANSLHGQVVSDQSFNASWITGTLTSDGVNTFTLNGHGLAVGDPVEFDANGGILPTGITQYNNDSIGGTYYNVATITANTFTVTATVGSVTPMALITTGSGTIRVRKAGLSAFTITGLNLQNDIEYEIYFRYSFAKKTTSGEYIYYRPNSDSSQKIYSQIGYANNIIWDCGNASTTKKYSNINSIVRLRRNTASKAYGFIESTGSQTDDKSTGITAITPITNNAFCCDNLAAEITSIYVGTNVGAALIRNGAEAIIVRR